MNSLVVLNLKPTEELLDPAKSGGFTALLQVARMARIGVAMWNVFVMVLMIVFFGN